MNYVIPLRNTLPLIMLLALPTLAFSSQTAQDIRALCSNPDADAKTACELYVQGFIDGAATTDPQVATSLLDESTELSGWMQRAIRTRIGDKIERLGPSVYANFCLPPEVEITSVVTELAELSSPGDDQLSSRDWVYQALQAKFPCPTQ